MLNAYPRSSSVYYHYRKWCLDGSWERINRTLVYLERQHQGQLPHPSAGVIDSQSAKTTECGGQRSDDGGKKVNGRKRYLITDMLGNLLMVVAHPAGTADSVGAKRVFEALHRYWQHTLQMVWADGAYEGGLATWVEHQFASRLSIIKRSTHIPAFICCHSAGWSTVPSPG